jgi:hypothetical protein
MSGFTARAAASWAAASFRQSRIQYRLIPSSTGKSATLGGCPPVRPDRGLLPTPGATFPTARKIWPGNVDWISRRRSGRLPRTRIIVAMPTPSAMGRRSTLRLWFDEPAMVM